MSVILPGGTLGILGGGQLGRMTAMAARSLGYHLAALDPDPSCAARFVVESCITAGFDDVAAARELARLSQVVTVEIEKIAVDALRAVQELVPMRPGPEVLFTIQDRARQKDWLPGPRLSGGALPQGVERGGAAGSRSGPWAARST